MHYNRLWRTGSLELKQPRKLLQHSGGYLVERIPGHPIVSHGAYAYQHRRVFYDAHGEGPFSCHVCGATVDWAGMHIDHLDDDPANNALGNLAPACPTCNQRRGQAKMSLTRKAQGKLLTAFGRTMCVADWAREVGIASGSINTRLRNGWGLERALSEPRGRHGPSSKRA